MAISPRQRQQLALLSDRFSGLREEINSAIQAFSKARLDLVEASRHLHSVVGELENVFSPTQLARLILGV